MRLRAEFGSESHIKLSGYVTREDFDRQLVTFLSTGRSPQNLLIDFRSATFIDLSVLFNVMSFFRRRKEKRLKTFIGIPREKKVRDFLRLWRFPKAFSDATGISFEDVLVGEDLKYRGEPQTTYNGLGSGLDALTYDRDWIETTGRRNFFEFTSYFLHPQQQSLFSGPTRAIPRIEAERWNNRLIREVLNTHFSKKRNQDDVARVVIYESISNAVRHPKASLIQTASIFQSETLKSRSGQSAAKKGHLRIFVWDDGEAIVDTLAPLIRNERTVRALRLHPYMYEKVYVEIKNFEGTETQKSVADQYEDPNRDAPEELILLSSLYPGVTRTASQLVDEVHPFEKEESPGLISWVKQQGMGLYALTRTAIDLYQGAITIRTSDLLLKITVARDQVRKKFSVRYRCTITRYPTRLPRFIGNLLVIELPIAPES